MKRANWMYLVATALVLSTGISVAGAKAKHHDSSSSPIDHKTKLHGRWTRDVVTTTTVVATTTTQPATTTTAAPTTTTLPPTTTTAAPTDDHHARTAAATDRARSSPTRTRRPS